MDGGYAKHTGLHGVSFATTGPGAVYFDERALRRMFDGALVLAITGTTGGNIHLIGGASAPKEELAGSLARGLRSQVDRRRLRKALPSARAHVGCVAHGGRIHVVGGRFNTFEYNTNLHHVFFPERDTWELRAPMPTTRSGHGLVVRRDRFFAMGGESGVVVNGQIATAKVYGQIESYDPASDTWQSHAHMPTPRHAVGAAAIGDAIYVAGGGAVTCGSTQSAVHGAFTLW